MTIPEPRPTEVEQMLALATDVAARSNCLKVHVGAVVTLDGRTRAVGYNGTVEHFPNCFDGGCPRCRDESITSGKQLDRCICVHAEENAIASAARFGLNIEGADVWVTHEPCLQCTKLLIQARVAKVHWLVPYQYDDRQDHSDSRRALRATATSKLKIEFEYHQATSKALKECAKRLEGFKAEAKRYGKLRRVFKSRRKKAARTRATSSAKSSGAARRRAGTSRGPRRRRTGLRRR